MKQTLIMKSNVKVKIKYYLILYIFSKRLKNLIIKFAKIWLNLDF